MTRLLSALALLVVIGGAAVFAPPEGLVLMAVAIASLGFIELARLGDALGARVPRAPGLCLTALVCICAAWPTLSLAPAMVALLVGAGVVAVTSGPPDRADVGGIALTVAGPLYIGLPLGALVSIGWTHGREAAFLVVLTVVASDSTAVLRRAPVRSNPAGTGHQPEEDGRGRDWRIRGRRVAMAWLGGLWLPAMPLGTRLLLASCW